jgi:hypothetical protein
MAYENYQFEGAHFSEFVDKSRDVLVRVSICLEELQPNNDDRTQPDETLHASHTTGPVHAHARSGGPDVRLPKLELPTFDGHPLQWQTFWQQFESAVHRQRIPDVQKLNYLLARLRDSALRAVEGYAVTNDNYALVVEALQKRFGDDKVLTEALEAELINLPQAGESLPSLRSHPKRSIVSVGSSRNSEKTRTVQCL